MDYSFFNIASEDQWMRNTSEIPKKSNWKISNMHSKFSLQEGVLPDWHIRSFVQKKESTSLEEINLKMKTVWFFPNYERVLMIWNGMKKIDTENSKCISSIMIAAEEKKYERDVAYYENILKKRNDKKFGILHSFCEEELISPSLISNWIDRNTTSNKSILDSFFKKKEDTYSSYLRKNNFSFLKRFKNFSSSKIPQLFKKISRYISILEKKSTIRKYSFLKKKNNSFFTINQYHRINKFLQISKNKIFDFGFDEKFFENMQKNFRNLLEFRKLINSYNYKDDFYSYNLFLNKISENFKNFQNLNFLNFKIFDANLKNLDFENSFLGHSEFHNCILYKINFKLTYLKYSYFYKNKIFKISFNNTFLDFSYWKESIFKDVVFSDISLKKIRFSKCKFINSIFDSIFFENSSFENCYFYHVHFKKCTFLKQKLENFDSECSIFKNVTLLKSKFLNFTSKNSFFSECFFIGSKLENYKIENSRFLDSFFDKFTKIKSFCIKLSNLKSINFREVFFEKCYFLSSNLFECDFSDCTIKYSKFFRIVLKSCSFIQAKIICTNFCSSFLENVFLQDIVFLKSNLYNTKFFRSDLSKIRVDKNTNFNNSSVQECKLYPKNS